MKQKKRIIYVVRYTSGATKLFRDKELRKTKIINNLEKFLHTYSVKWVHVHLSIEDEKINKYNKIGWITHDKLSLDY